MTHPDDIILPIRHRSGVPAIIKAKLDLDGEQVQPSWVLPGGEHIATRREAYRRGMAIFKAAGWE